MTVPSARADAGSRAWHCARDQVRRYGTSVAIASR